MMTLNSQHLHTEFWIPIGEALVPYRFHSNRSFTAARLAGE